MFPNTFINQATEEKVEFLNLFLSAVAAGCGVIAVMCIQLPTFLKTSAGILRGLPYVDFTIETNLPGVRLLSLRVEGFDVNPTREHLPDPFRFWSPHASPFVPELKNVIESGRDGLSEQFTLVLRDKDGTYPSVLPDVIKVEMVVSWRWFTWRRQTTIRP